MAGRGFVMCYEKNGATLALEFLKVGQDRVCVVSIEVPRGLIREE